MELLFGMYIILAFFALMSCVGGPILVVRWVAIPFHLLIGVFLHAYGIYCLFTTRYTELGD